jgi:hypothetical protein
VGGTIPLWVPLVVAILGLIGTVSGAIAGVVITQRRSDARDRAARKCERERWAREDAAPHGRPAARGVYQVLCRRGAQINDFLDNKGYLRRERRQKAIDPRNRSFDAEFAVLAVDRFYGQRRFRMPVFPDSEVGPATESQHLASLALGVDADGVNSLGHACSGARTPIM